MNKPTVDDLKAMYLQFYSEFPVQRAAADFIGKNEDTIIKWRDSDKDFAEAVSRAKSEWARKAHRKIRPDNLLARLYDDLKPPKQETDVNLITDVTINHVHPNDQLPTVAETGAGVPVPDQPDNN